MMDYSKSFYDLANQIIKKGGRIASRQFQGAHVAEILDMVSIQKHFPNGIVVTQGRSTKKPPLAVFQMKPAKGMVCDGVVTIDQVRHNLEDVVAKLRSGHYYAVRRIKMDDSSVDAAVLMLPDAKPVERAGPSRHVQAGAKGLTHDPSCNTPAFVPRATGPR